MTQLLLALIYLAFISLGLPDSLLGSGWPSMYPAFGVPISYAGVISTICAVGTVVSSILSDRLTRRLGTGKIMVLSVGMTALALFGFSVSRSFLMLCLWSVPYGLGAGSVDAALNNYVALHFKSRHMNWLHCMWGVGASLSPYVMGYALTSGRGWSMGYRYISVLQTALTVILMFSLPLWKKRGGEKTSASPETNHPVPEKALSIKQVLNIPGAKEIFVAFFCECALESTTGLWSSSFLVLERGLTPEAAARFVSLFFLGITVGRAVSGFLSIAVSDVNMTRLGQGLIFLGICVFILPGSEIPANIGLILIGLGCAPIYPSIVHSTPANFGADKSQAVIGIQMACAYMGSCFAPPLFGLIAQYVHIALFPVFLLLILAVMALTHEMTVRKVRKAR